MRLEAALAVLVCAAGLTMGPACDASAQTLIPTDVLGHKDKDKDKDKERPKPSKPCGHGVTLICAGEKVTKGAADIAGDAAKVGVGAAGDAVMGGIVSWAASGAAWLVTEIGKQIDRSARPALGSAWFGRQYGAVRDLAIALSLAFLLAAVLHSIIRQDLRMLAHAVGVALPLALLLTFVAITLVEIALAVTDWMTKAALAGFNRDADRAFRDIGELLAPTALTANPLPGLVVFLAAALTAALALLVWVELVLREASIYVAVSFLPLAFVALVWRPTAHWARRLAEWLGAIIISKFTIAAAFAIAGSALAHGRGGGNGGLTVLLAGCAVLLVAALTPWVLLRMLPGNSAASGGLHRGSVRGAAASTAGATTATMVARQAMVRSFGGAVAATRVKPTSARPAAPPLPPTPKGRGPNPPSAGGPRLDSPARRDRVPAP